jgi:hypothetical protein
LRNRSELSLSARVGFDASGGAWKSLDGPLAPGADARLYGELKIGPYTGPGDILTLRAIATVSVEGEAGEFRRFTDATLRVPAHPPAVPASDAVASRCQSQQLRALARDCESSLTCVYSANPKRCIRGSVRRFHRAYDAALARAVRSGGTCPYSDARPNLTWPLVSTIDPGRIYALVQYEKRSARRLAERLEEATADLCRAELEAWAERAAGAAASDVEDARQKFLQRARRAIARAESSGWIHGGWTPEAIADMVRAGALRAAFWVGGHPYDWWSEPAAAL